MGYLIRVYKRTRVVLLSKSFGIQGLGFVRSVEVFGTFVWG